MSKHRDRAKMLLNKAQHELATAEDPDSIEVALISALTGIGEAMLEQAEQLRISNQIFLVDNIQYEVREGNFDSNPSGRTLTNWMADLYEQVKDPE